MSDRRIHIKVKRRGTGTNANPVRCILPTWRLTKEIGNNTLLVSVPEEYVKPNGDLNNKLMGSMYSYQKKELELLDDLQKSAVEKWQSFDFVGEQA